MAHRTGLKNVGWLVFIVLGSVYLITYRGLFRSVDELALFSLTESLAQTGSTDIPQLAFATYHNIVGRLEPLHSALAVPFYWVAVHCARLGNIQTAMLLNVLLTAATGAVVYVLLVALAHPPGRAVAAALLYGLATLAWPYSRAFYREPLIALLYAAAVLGFVRWRQTRRVRYVAMMLGCLALNLAAKVTTALVWPAFALAFILGEDVPVREFARRLGRTLVAGVVGAGAVAGVYVLRTGHGLARLIEFSYALARPALVLSRTFGLTFSAGRGVFVFAPILLLALPGLVLLWRRRRGVAMLSLLSALATVTGYSLYSDWHGGMSWGPRFVVPVLPLLMPCLAEWLSVDRTWARALSWLLAGLSLLMQIVASTADYSVQIEAGSWDNVTDYARSPAVQQFLVWGPENLDMLWWHGPVPGHLEQGSRSWQIGLPVWVCLGMSVTALALRVRRGTRPGPRGSDDVWVRWLPLGLGAFLVAAAANLLLRAPLSNAGYPGVDPGELRQVAAILNQDDAPHLIVTVSNEFHLNVLLNDLKGRFVHRWLSPLQKDDLDVWLGPLLDPPFSAQSLRLLVDRVHMPPEQYGRDVEFWLNAHLHRYLVEWVGGGYEVYSYLYPPAKMPLTDVDYRWAAGMTMSAYGMTPRTAVPGDPVWLEFHCSAERAPEGDYDLFVQFLAPDGRFVNGTDGPPQFGARLTSRWSEGEQVVDRRAFVVPPGSPPGTYWVIAGFYEQGQRESTVDGSGRPVGTHVELGSIEVVAR